MDVTNIYEKGIMKYILFLRVRTPKRLKGNGRVGGRYLVINQTHGFLKTRAPIMPSFTTAVFCNFTLPNLMALLFALPTSALFLTL